MDESALYCAVPSSLFAVTRDRALALTQDGELCEVGSVAGRLLGQCQGWKTIQEHALAAWRSGVTADPQALATAVDELMQSGLLRKLDVPDGSVQGPDGAGIDSVAFVTADRPDMISRGLASAARHAAQFGRRPQFVVIDGSESLARETQVAAHAAAQASGCDVEYIGRQESATLFRTMAKEGISPQVLDFAASPGPIGRNRNAALLRTAGERLLMIDDDILCDPWVPTGTDAAVRIVGHVDTREWRFFPSRAEALSAVAHVELDVFAAHGNLLGRPLSVLLRGAGLEHACAHIVSSATAGLDPAVRVTMAGLAGDSARYCPHRLLFLPGPLHELFKGEPATLATALSSREVHNVARSTTVTHDAMCMSYCVGIDNGHLVPPFMPIGRGEDSVFGAMLGYADRLALFAHLPFGVLHDSSRASAYGSDEMPSARQTRLSEVLLALTGDAVRFVVSDSVAQRLVRLGQYLVDLGQVPGQEFIALVTRVALRLRCSQLDQLETSLASASGDLTRLRSALDEYRSVFRSSTSSPSFFLPLEFRGTGSIDDGFRRMQTFMTDFGSLIRLWPDIWEAAAVANAQRSR